MPGQERITTVLDDPRLQGVGYDSRLTDVDEELRAGLVGSDTRTETVPAAVSAVIVTASN